MDCPKPEFRYNEESGWQEKVPWTDEECILICLYNCRYLAGLDRDQVDRLIRERGGTVH